MKKLINTLLDNYAVIFSMCLIVYYSIKRDEIHTFVWVGFVLLFQILTNVTEIRKQLEKKNQ